MAGDGSKDQTSLTVITKDPGMSEGGGDDEGIGQQRMTDVRHGQKDHERVAGLQRSPLLDGEADDEPIEEDGEKLCREEIGGSRGKRVCGGGVGLVVGGGGGGRGGEVMMKFKFFHKGSSEYKV